MIRTRRRIGRWIAVAAAILIVVPILAWSAFWLFARYQAGAQMAAITEASPNAPIQLACGGRSIGGFPLDITISCQNPVVTVAGDNGAVTLRFPLLTITTRLIDPRDQTIELQGPLEATDALHRARADWTILQIGLRGDAPVIDSILLRSEGLTLACDACVEVLRLTKLSKLEILAQRRGDTNDFSFNAGFSGLLNGFLARVTASDKPAVVSASGLITAFELPTSLRLAAEAERWRRDNGQIVIDAASLDQDALHAELSGRFAFDAYHRPAGTFEVGARNAAALVSAFTGSLNPLLQLAIGAALRGIDDAAAKSGGLAVKLPGKIENGALSIGPARGIFSVPPLY